MEKAIYKDFESFVDSVGSVSLCEFVDIFFKGSVSEFARSMNISRQLAHKWVNSESPEYEAEVIYCEFEDGKITYDYLIKKHVKRVGAVSNEFFDPHGYVYAVSNGSLTKIGASKRPAERAKTVARNLGFDNYETFISNPCVGYKAVERSVHNALADKRRENTIYLREVFSCSLDEAANAIREATPDMPTGPRKTNKQVVDSVMESLGTR